MVMNFFLISHLNLPSFSLQLFRLVLSLHTLVKSPSPSFLQTPSGTGSCSEVTPEPSLLQSEQPQLPQPVLVGEVLQPSDHLRGPPLDLLQHIHVLLMLGAPELDAGLQVGSQESGVKGQNPLPRPAGRAALDAARDTVGWLSGLPAHIASSC